jgi:CRP-like cAMP-binding protein
MKPIHPSKLNQAIIDFLINFPFFSELTIDELAILGEYISIYQVQPNEVIVREGDESVRAYFVLDGELDVIREAVNGKTPGVKKVPIEKLGSGSSVGELGIIADFLSPITVKSFTQAHVVGFSKDGFEEISQNHPAVGLKIAISLCKMLSKRLLTIPGQLAECVLLDQDMQE